MKGFTLAELHDLPATVDLLTAARALGLGRTKAYELAKKGEFPCRVIRVGVAYLVPTAELLKLLGVDPPASSPR
ncbi:helix-turn-helix domain-containing protein [Microtetraspora sp. NBRC 16547]|uniref:helix-turn-helix domain-containing protein n=1 Tax=Microtetraspora sp. NBRC 16547 TaxID=3030993 RepID=UPI00249FC7D7|nr:helix-turn-helix domain-containing protein [Microtetraspora sp. NBRC 16547]GLW98903.1 integrase [Microtetraspora sp. NBRC 16547]